MSAARSQMDAHGALLALVRLRQTLRPGESGPPSGVRVNAQSFDPLVALEDEDDDEFTGRYAYVDRSRAR